MINLVKLLVKVSADFLLHILLCYSSTENLMKLLIIDSNFDLSVKFYFSWSDKVSGSSKRLGSFMKQMNLAIKTFTDLTTSEVLVETDSG